MRTTAPLKLTIAKVLLIALLAALVSPSVASADGEFKLQNREATRYAYTFFEVCKVSLFTQRTLYYEDVMSGLHPFRLKLEYLRDVGKSEYHDGWGKALIKKSNAPEALAKGIVKLLPESVAENQILSFEWNPDSGLDVRLDGQKRGTLHDPQEFRAIVNTLLGPDGPRGVPEAVLGTRPTRRIE